MEEEDRALAQAIADSEKKVTEDRPTPSTKLSGGRGREDTRNEQQTVLLLMFCDSSPTLINQYHWNLSWPQIILVTYPIRLRILKPIVMFGTMNNKIRLP